MRRYVIGFMTAVALMLSWPGVASAATGWVRQPAPLPPGAMFGMTTGVSCPTAGDCTAVGFSNNLAHSNRHPLAEQWTGGAWTVQPVARPAGFAGGVLAAVSCVSPGRCTAVGEYSSQDSSSLLAEAWNGSRWAVQAMPNPPGAISSLLLGVSCTSAAGCTAVGSTEGQGITPLAEHWNGSTWAIQSVPGHGTLSGVSCTGPAACMAVGTDDSTGGPAAEQWNGSTWTVRHAPAPAGATGGQLSAVSCTSATDCTAVGFYTNSADADQPLAETWNGITWTVRPAAPHPGGAADDLNGVSCTSVARCTAVGGGGLAEVWNGTRWTVQQTASPAGRNLFESVSCVAARTCTAVGDGSSSASGHKALPLAEHE